MPSVVIISPRRFVILSVLVTLCSVKEMFSQDIPCNATRRGNRTECSTGYCLHGECHMFDKDSNFTFCNCYSEWRGRYCEKCCDLRCQHGGVCYVDQPSDKYCLCSYTRYTGEFCEHREVFNCSVPARESWTRCSDIWCFNGDCDKHITESGQSYETCLCDRGWGGLKCDVCCDLPCLNNGSCKVENGDTPQCDCFGTGYHGEFCQLQWKVKETTTYTTPIQSTSKPASPILVAVTVSILFPLSVLAVAVIVIIRKRRSSFTRHITRFSKWEKESKKYDVMLLFSCNHEASCNFVARELLPAIEDLELNVCSNQPSVLPETATEESITKASQESKRIILLLSQQFIDDCDNLSAGATENTDMLEVLDTERTLAIIMESLDEQSCYFLGLPLSYIFESVVCLNYAHYQPGGRAARKFWKKLRLCLPRKSTQLSVSYFSV